MRRLSFYLLALILIVLFIAGLIQIYAERKVKERVDSFLSALDLKDRTSYRRVRYSILTGVVEIEDLEIRGQKGKAKIGKVIVRKLTDRDLEIELRGIHSQNGEFEEKMKELGYKNASMNALISASLYEDSHELIVRNFSIDVPQAFRIDWKLDLKGIDRSLIKELISSKEKDKEKVAKLTEKLSKVKLLSSELRFTDTGLIERLLMKEAEQKNKNLEDIKEEVIKSIDKSLKGGSSKFEKEFAEALKEFLQTGGTLIFTVNPENPMGFQDLVLLILVSIQTREYDQLINELNLEIKHES